MTYNYKILKHNSQLFESLLDKYSLPYTSIPNLSFTTYYIYSKSIQDLMDLSLEFGILL